MVYTVAALYKFAPLADAAARANHLRERCAALGLQGTLLLAEEGINGTVAGSEESITTLINELRAIDGLEDLTPKLARSEVRPFHRLKVKHKAEIVTFRDPLGDPATASGTYVNAAEWNALLEEDDVVVIDTRNDFEVAVGSFPGAVSPKTRSFTDFKRYVANELSPEGNPKVAMFCTGGIRCEKASAYLVNLGFEQVYQLNGGILKYFEDTDETSSKWHGECFVFDQRVSVDQDLAPGTFSLCYGCQEPVSADDRKHPDYEYGVSCPKCAPTLSASRRASLRMRVSQVALSAERGGQHIGSAAPRPNSVSAHETSAD